MKYYLVKWPGKKGKQHIHQELEKYRMDYYASCGPGLFVGNGLPAIKTWEIEGSALPCIVGDDGRTRNLRSLVGVCKNCLRAFEKDKP